MLLLALDFAALIWAKQRPVNLTGPNTFRG